MAGRLLLQAKGDAIVIKTANSTRAAQPGFPWG